ncbi:MAG TPA: DUF2442 domain-containing protein [Longimicrobiaceae bacterium]|nr:DUF2442 domain-containing protein [Longimicrobiaceae bacterium]
MAEMIPSEAEILAQVAGAMERGRIAADTEPRAQSAYYDEASGRIAIELTNGCLFAFPSDKGQGLRGATREQLAAVEVLPGGSGLHWEELDADLSVPGLVAGVFGSQAWMRELGRAGGRMQTPAKAQAARENGRKGGRPRKQAG